MANSTTNLDTISVGQSAKELTANELFDAGSPATLFGRRATTTSGLTWGWYGGTVDVGGTLEQLANGTITLTNNATNYLEWDSTGSPTAVIKNTSGWTGGDVVPLYSVVVSGGAVTSYQDWRTSSAGASMPVGGLGNPTASVGLTAVNGVATTAMRSDGAPALSQAIAPTWTAKHIHSFNAAALPALATTIVHAGGADGVATFHFLADAFGAGPAYVLRRANTSAAAPSAVLSGQGIGTLQAWGYGATGYSAASRAYLGFMAGETWTDSAQGAYIDLATTANGGTSRTVKFSILGNGALSIGSAGTGYGTSGQVMTSGGNAAPTWSPLPVLIQLACSDETTALTAGTAKVTFRAPFAFTLTSVRASVTTAPTGGTLLTVDINESGTTVLSTKLTFDASEKTTTTAATPAVISDSAIADDAEITIDIDAIGSTIAGAGLKVTLIGTRV